MGNHSNGARTANNGGNHKTGSVSTKGAVRYGIRGARGWDIQRGRVVADQWWVELVYMVAGGNVVDGVVGWW